jgi:uncharacterized protein
VAIFHSKKHMKAIILIIFLGLSLTGWSQMKDYNIVFDITSAEPLSQQAVIRQVSMIKQANPDAKLEVVIYGQGLNLVLKDSTAYKADLEKLIQMKDVSFSACAVTMERRKATKADLVTGVQTVPDGIYEILTRQRQGWGYIKVAN